MPHEPGPERRSKHPIPEEDAAAGSQFLCVSSPQAPGIRPPSCGARSSPSARFYFEGHPTNHGHGLAVLLPRSRAQSRQLRAAARLLESMRTLPLGGFLQTKQRSMDLRWPEATALPRLHNK